MPQLSLHSPVGDLAVSEEDGAIVALDWGWGAVQTDSPLLVAARDQLNAYFDGTLKDFDLPLRPHGTAFEQRVWRAMQRIPYGATASYGDLAARLETAARAIGGACATNPIPIIIPCHRVLAANGGLGGYSGNGGRRTKRALLQLEQAVGVQDQLL